MAKESKASDVRFLVDSTDDKDGAKEVIMDYVISWMLRRAQNICKDDKPILYKYCRKFLGNLLGKTLTDSDVVEVETWKQYEHIDLWALVKVNGVEHHILIEDKYYSRVHNDQLSRYKKIFDTWLDHYRPYVNNNQRCYWLLTCLESDMKNVYDGAQGIKEFNILTWDQMLEIMGIDANNPKMSESDIFNEFWLEKWV